MKDMNERTIEKNIIRGYRFQIAINSVFIVIAIMGYVYDLKALSIVSCVSMYTLSMQIFFKVKELEVDYQVEDMLDKEHKYRTSNFLYLYIISAVLFGLGFIQNINIITFGDLNNLFVTISIATYSIYSRKKSYEKYIKASLKQKEYRDKFIEENGLEAWEKHDKEVTDFFNKIENDIKDFEKEYRKNKKH